MPVTSLRFLYDGRRINSYETPNALEMEDNALIDVFRASPWEGSHGEKFMTWRIKVRAALVAQGEDRMELVDMKMLHNEARGQKYPGNKLLEALQLAVKEADKCQKVVEDLCKKWLRKSSNNRITLGELHMFASKEKNLHARVNGREWVTVLLDCVDIFQKSVLRLLNTEVVKVEEIENCLTIGEELEIGLKEMNQMRSKIDQLTWLEEVKEFVEDLSEAKVKASSQLESAGMSLQPHPNVQRGLDKLREIRIALEGREETKAKEKLFNFLSNSIVEKEKGLECPVCLFAATIPIYMCQESHLICSTCRPKVTRCPECRVELRDEGQPRRHRYAEMMVEDLDKLRNEMSNV